MIFFLPRRSSLQAKIIRAFINDSIPDFRFVSHTLPLRRRLLVDLFRFKTKSIPSPHLLRADDDERKTADVRMQTGPESKLPAARHMLTLRLLSARCGHFHHYRKAGSDQIAERADALYVLSAAPRRPSGVSEGRFKCTTPVPKAPRGGSGDRRCVAPDAAREERTVETRQGN